MRKPIVLALIVGLVGAVAALGIMPREPRLTRQSTGDTSLAADVRAALPDAGGHRGLAVAVLENGRVRTAGLGDRDRAGRPVEPGTPFEIGSITKVMTGMLLARQAATGAVRPDDPVGAVLPELSGPTREATLAELASHRSGLPRLATTSVGDLVGAWWANLTGGNPYAGRDAGWLLDAAGEEEPGDGRGEVHYSNLGVALLGQALATRAGTSYPELLDRELLRPLGMTSTVVATDADALPPGRAEGSTAGGRAVEAWVSGGYAPAGVGPWSTAGDLARLLGATLAGTAPGADAATPRFTEDDRNRIGYGWFTTRYGDREIVWHNGATGGFHAYLGFERATGRGVVVLGNTAKGVEPIGLRLLGVPARDADGDGPPLPVWIGAGLAVVLTFLGGLSLLGTTRRAPDRLTLAPAVAWAVLYPALGHRLGDWSMVPGWLWPLGAGVSAAGIVLAAYRWRGLPSLGGAPPWRRLTSAAFSALLAILAILILTA
ncbi:beta-lactamase family protein [Micromonospora sp. AMSO12t]|uniref:serine hydrolase domain-containing protein n=1 Tax=unclassified Micromonospora TaxID=2617518 RepID=UPI00124B1797|nr:MULTISPECIES: serine hydrolase domain-containing protein [unclassified Micromonospora]KAB1128716.1 beta-lactamase family protein [Micromonospora sp. AMSO12t]WSG04510.1 beta-lactamase family protein [Micromonospora sp. NBC_01740]